MPIERITKRVCARSRSRANLVLAVLPAPHLAAVAVEARGRVVAVVAAAAVGVLVVARLEAPVLRERELGVLHVQRHLVLLDGRGEVLGQLDGQLLQVEHARELVDGEGVVHADVLEDVRVEGLDLDALLEDLQDAVLVGQPVPDGQTGELLVALPPAAALQELESGHDHVAVVLRRAHKHLLLVHLVHAAELARDHLAGVDGGLGQVRRLEQAGADVVDALDELDVEVHVEGKQPALLGALLLRGLLVVLHHGETLGEQLLVPVLGAEVHEVGVGLADQTLAERADAQLRNVAIEQNLRRDVGLGGELVDVGREQQLLGLVVEPVQSLVEGQVEAGPDLLTSGTVLKHKINKLFDDFGGLLVIGGEKLSDVTVVGHLLAHELPNLARYGVLLVVDVLQHDNGDARSVLGALLALSETVHQRGVQQTFVELVIELAHNGLQNGHGALQTLFPGEAGSSAVLVGLRIRHVGFVGLHGLGRKQRLRVVLQLADQVRDDAVGVDPLARQHGAVGVGEAVELNVQKRLDHVDVHGVRDVLGDVRQGLEVANRLGRVASPLASLLHNGLHIGLDVISREEDLLKHGIDFGRGKAEWIVLSAQVRLCKGGDDNVGDHGHGGHHTYTGRSHLPVAVVLLLGSLGLGLLGGSFGLGILGSRVALLDPPLGQGRLVLVGGVVFREAGSVRVGPVGVVRVFPALTSLGNSFLATPTLGSLFSLRLIVGLGARLRVVAALIRDLLTLLAAALALVVAVVKVRILLVRRLLQDVLVASRVLGVLLQHVGVLLVELPEPRPQGVERDGPRLGHLLQGVLVLLLFVDELLQVNDDLHDQLRYPRGGVLLVDQLREVVVVLEQLRKVVDRLVVLHGLRVVLDHLDRLGPGGPDDAVLIVIARTVTGHPGGSPAGALRRIAVARVAGVSGGVGVRAVRILTPELRLHVRCHGASTPW
ncbi:uncharacterized protein BcabD6B2_08730 [Babesia caballi]|uniref:Uncharacterized protein n=1 Tax=Babesia caballi TaxID=5871 RepID=A0AAV4LMQ4_BABCB|nr:hypothetical protein BcabD6B2_08730 [Babesia caballi]